MGKKSQMRREKKIREEKERKVILSEINKQKNPWSIFWMRVDFWVYVAAFIAIIAFPFVHPEVFNPDSKAIIHTSMGDIEIGFYKKDAPKTTENFIGLAKEGYYDGLLWHRVVKGFVIQAGDPKGDGSGGKSLWGNTFADEINPTSLDLSQTTIQNNEKNGYTYNNSLTSHKIVKGSVAMANSGPNTNGSQFFIVTDQDQPSLDGQYTDFGYVISGLDVAQKIEQVAVDKNDKPTSPVYITSVELR